MQPTVSGESCPEIPGGTTYLNCQRLYVLCAAAADLIVSELGVLPAGDAASSGAGAEVTVTVR